MIQIIDFGVPGEPEAAAGEEKGGEA